MLANRNESILTRLPLQKFQEIEENHLKQMKEFLSTYIELLQNNHDMVGQVSFQNILYH